MNENEITEINWVEYYDNNTEQPYYINKITRHSQFEIPEEYEEWKQNEIEKYLKKTNWRRRKDEKKNAYYYLNKITNKVQWEIPKEEEEFIEFLKEVNRNRTDWGEIEDDGEGQEGQEEREEEGQEENYYDEEETENYNRNKYDHEVENLHDNYSDSPNNIKDDNEYSSFSMSNDEENNLNYEDQQNLKELEILEAKLSAKDAIMEPTINQTIHKYLRAVPDATPASIVTKLSAGYVGYAQLTHIICGWISFATEDSNKKSNFDEDSFIAKEMCSLIKRKFNKDIADRLIDENTGVPGWLHEMMHDSTWRKLLIELFDESGNKGSVLLGYCLRYLSSQGYHREIAHVISEADYFQVFNDLLIDLISRLGHEFCGVTNPNRRVDSNENIEDSSIVSLLKDFKRMCCSSEYMFLYAQELLFATEIALQSHSTLKRKLNLNNDEEHGEIKNKKDIDMKSLWRKKMRRLAQELDQNVIWTDKNETSPISLTHSKAFTLKLTTLFDHHLINDDLSNSQIISGLNIHKLTSIIPSLLDSNDISESIISELSEIFFGIDKIISDSEFHLDNQQQQQSLSSSKAYPIETFLSSAPKDSISLLLGLVLHPHYLIILTRALIHPLRSIRKSYSQRRVASLLSLVPIFQRFQIQKNNHENQTFTLNIQELTLSITNLINVTTMCIEMSGLGVGLNLLTSSKYLQFLETLKESFLSIICLYWVRCSLSDIQFLRGSRQCTLYPVIMQIITQSIDFFPLQRQECLEILQICYKTTYVGLVDAAESKQEISKDIIDIVVHLMGKGYVSPSMEFLIENFPQDSPHKFDTALIRHLIMRLLAVISPPYTTCFKNHFINLILHPSSRKALESQHFTSEAVSSLRRFSDTISLNDEDIEKKRIDELRLIVALSGKSTGTFIRR